METQHLSKVPVANDTTKTRPSMSHKSRVGSLLATALSRLASDRAYFFALDLYFIITFVRTTMFQEVIPTRALNVAAFVALFLFFVRFLREFQKLPTEAKMLEVAALVLLLPPVITNDNRAPLYFGLLAFSALNVNLDKVLKRYLLISCVCCVVTVASAYFGIILNVSAERGSATYYAWGFYYLTEFSAHLISLCLVCVYLARNRLRPWHALLTLAMGALTYLLTNSRLSLVMFVLASVAVVLLTQKKTATIFCKQPVAYTFIALALISLAGTVAYSPNSQLMVVLDNILTNRLAFSSKGLWEYGITLFGQPLPMQGWGGSQKVWGDHVFYLDCSYINILLRCGMVPLLVVLWLLTRNLQRAQHRNNSALAACLILIAINSVINEHLIDVTYDPFLFALLASSTHARHLNEWSEFSQLTEARACHKIARFLGRAINQRHVGDFAQDPRTNKYPHNPVLAGKDDECLFDPCVIRFEKGYRMYVSRRSDGSIVAYDSIDGIHWDYRGTCLQGRQHAWDATVNRCCVINSSNTWHMWYTGQHEGRSAIGVAQSKDGLHFKRLRNSPALSPELEREGISAMNPSVVLSRETGAYQMLYAAGEDYEPDAIWRATSVDGITWEKSGANPVLTADSQLGFQSYKVGGPDVYQTKDGGYVLLYIGYQNLDVARVCVAYSADGNTWTRAHEPLITPGPESWDSCSVYKPTAMQLKNGQTAVWYNGRKDHKESIGLVLFDGNLFMRPRTSSEAHPSHSNN